LDRYLALYRSGALEVGLGHEVRSEGPSFAVFRLTLMVGRMWAGLAANTSVIDRYGIAGPWEVSLEVSNTLGSRLGNFGEGWAEPLDAFREMLPCPTARVFLRLECSEWPSDAAGVQELAFRMGGRIEDAWGVKERRFLARTGKLAGQFALERYGWG
jgi:hypothetical protein